MQHALNTQDPSFVIFNQINKIDYLKNWGDLFSSFSVEQSFTLLDWLIIETVAGDASF